MDTKKDSAVSEVPTFKVARVGKDRKRKGAGFSWLRSGGARGGFSGAVGGAGEGGVLAGLGGAGGAGGFFAGNLAKALLVLMIASGMTATAMYVGSLSGDGNEVVAKKGPFMDKDVKLEGDTSNLPSTANSIPNSLGYLSGSLDGLTPEERARRAAEEAARKAAEEEEARKAAEAEAAAAKGNGVDPNALLASAKADGGNGGSKLDKRFGALSSSFGGGSSLAGGAGLSGGVNRNFGGMGGGAGSIKKGSTGQLSRNGTTARPSYSRAGTGRAAGSNLKGFARKQLANANAYSRKGATASKGETAAYDAGTAFDNNQGAGNVISGPGIGAGSGPNSGSDGSVNPGPQSGPTGNPPPAACNSNEAPDANGVCQPIQTQQMKKDTKWDWVYQAAMAMLMTLTVLSGIALMANAANIFGGAGEAIKSGIRIAMGVIGGILMALGALMIMKTGDKIAGGIVAALGTWTMANAIWPEIVTGNTVQQVALKIFLPTLIGGFAAAGTHKPAAASQ